MDWLSLHNILVIVQRSVSGIGILIIISGVLFCVSHYIVSIVNGQFITNAGIINSIRLTLSRILILGLEFIVAGDLIGTTTTPDYYEVGLLGIIVLIRTVLSYSIGRELESLKKEPS